MMKNEDIENGKMAIAVCEPLYLSQHFMKDGHSAEKANGTITYVRYKNHIFGITCAHVYFSQFDDDGVASKCLMVYGNRTSYHFGVYTENGYSSHFRSMRKNKEDVDQPDIAIVHLGGGYEELHMEQKNKHPIELEKLIEPDWENAKMCMATGFPTEHKTQTETHVSAGLAQVTAECTGKLSSTRDKFMLFSSLSEPHNVFFSGMSGGPIFCDDITGQNTLTLVGIVFEGMPGSSADWNSRRDDSFLNSADVQIHGYTLTPKIFEGWLRKLKFINK